MSKAFDKDWEAAMIATGCWTPPDLRRIADELRRIEEAKHVSRETLDLFVGPRRPEARSR